MFGLAGTFLGAVAEGDDELEVLGVVEDEDLGFGSAAVA